MVWFVASKTAHDQIQAKSYAEYYADDTEKRIERDCAKREGSALIECVKEIIETSHQQQRDEHDLAAQRGMELWAFWMLVATLSSVAVTAVGVIYVALTLKEARATTAAAIKGADTAQATFEAELRPWLRITPIVSGPMVHTKKGVVFEVDIEVENIGKMPARDMIIATDFMNIAVRNDEEFNRNFAGFFDMVSEFPGLTQLPSEKGREKHKFGFNYNEIEKKGANGDIEKKALIPLIMIGVSYREMSRDDVHRTIRCYRLLANMPNSDDFTIPWKLAGIRAEHIVPETFSPGCFTS